MIVLTHGDWSTNAEMVAEGLVPLGYLGALEPTLDMTYGLGKWWARWRPVNLTGIDINPEKSPIGRPVDYRCTGFEPGEFSRITLDGPYRLNGTPDTESDASYGVDVPATWQERHASICDGITEAARLLERKGILIVKCQPQVCSGQKRWQPRIFANHAETVGFRQLDELQFPSFRDQPSGRRQVHSRINYSVALVLVKR